VESKVQINAWVAEVTRGLIKEMVNPNQQSKETLNVVINAIYLKGKWRNPFSKGHH
jgi:serpin B